jgi:uncharacterized protein (TIGR02598 family)
MGFSLVEVTLAMAVMAIGLIAILGLIPQGVTSSRGAADNTLVATIVHDIFNATRAQPFAGVNLNSAAYPFGFPLGPYNLQFPKLDTAYFDQSGLSPLTPADDYFKVVLSFAPQTPQALSVVTASVFWPAKQGMASFLNTNTFVTLVAQYQ